MKFKKEFDNDCINSSVFKKIYRDKECSKTGKCTLCPWHGGIDNTSHRPKTDKYKDRRKGKI